MGKKKSPDKGSAIEPSQDSLEFDGETERKAVLAALRLMPARMRSTQLAELFARTMHDPELRQDFRSRPAEYLHTLCISYPKGVKLDVHVNTEDTLHIVLPHPAMGARAERQTENGQTVVSDEDMVSSGQATAVSHVKDDSYNSGNWFRDPTDKDAKRDKTSITTGDYWDTFWEDKDPTTSDSGDKGKDGGTD